MSGISGDVWRISGDVPAGLSFDGGTLSGVLRKTGKFPLAITGGNGAAFVRKDYVLSVRGNIPSVSTSVRRVVISYEISPA